MEEDNTMILSLSLIAVTAFYGVSPWVLILLLITWIPDVVLTACIFNK